MQVMERLATSNYPAQTAHVLHSKDPLCNLNRTAKSEASEIHQVSRQNSECFVRFIVMMLQKLVLSVQGFPPTCESEWEKHVGSCS